MAGLLWLGSMLCVLAVAAVGLSAWGARRWTNATKALMCGLEAARVDGQRSGQSPPTRYAARELDGLPAPRSRRWPSSSRPDGFK